MIATQKPRTVETDGIQNSVAFGIKDSGLAHIFNVLRNQLYTDKVTAVIREYSTNACDAHVEAGVKERPIEVTLPSRFNLEFKVRDFGPALSDKDIQDIYAFYGESTKRNTNEQTGMLGIGSKSAFAYGDNFVINSYLDGQKHTYNAFIDDTQVGQISKLASVETDEENGIEIVIPTRSEDVDEFKSKSNTLFRYFKVKPIVNGKQLEYDENEVLYSGEGWRYLNLPTDRWSRNVGDSVVVMGNIGYPIDSDLLKLENDSPLSNFACANLILEMPLGELEISASREGLQYTDYTIKNITKKLQEAADAIAKEIEKDFKNCETLWQAKVLSSQLFDYSGKLYPVQHFVKKNITWNGQKIGDTYVTHKYDDEAEWHSYSKSYRANSKVTSSNETRINANDNTVLILNDKHSRRGAISKMVYQVETESKNPYILTFKKDTTTKQQNKYLKDMGLSREDFVMLKDLPDAVLDGRYSTVSSGGYNPKGSASVFVPNQHSTNGWRTDPQSSYWDTVTVDLKTEKVLYVVLERFQYLDSRGYAMDSRRFSNLAETFKSFTKGYKVVGVKTAHKHKFVENKNAVDLWEHLKTKLETEIEKANISTECANFVEYEKLDRVWHNFAEYCDKFDKESLIGRFVHQISEVRKLKEAFNDDNTTNLKAKRYQKVKQLANELNTQLPDGTPTFSESITESIRSQYPMLALTQEPLTRSWYGDDTKMETRVEIFADYTRQIDSPCE